MDKRAGFRRLTYPLAVAAAIALLPAGCHFAAARSAAQNVAAPADTAGKVILQHADRLVKNEMTADETGEYQVLTGNVRMRKDGMTMTCDSAHFYDQANSFEAFGNVRMEQGDTLFVYGDQLFYNGADELATLYADPGKTVRLINRDVTLRTYVFYYDLANEVGYYENWGQLTDVKNRLTSIEGEYHPSTKDAWFYGNVELFSPGQDDTTTMVTDSLNYNTATQIAEIVSRAVISNKNGVIISTSGTYETPTGVANLYDRSTVRTNRGNTLTGDTLFFDRNLGIGEAFGNMVLTDSARHTSLHGNYGYYNDPLDSAFVTGRALAKEYSGADTLYLHGDTINAYVVVENVTDSVKITNVFHNVRFYRSDLQGICDSLSATSADSLLRMFRGPVVWSGERQVYGNVIFVHSNDSVPDWARLPDSGLMSEHIAEDCYNQLSGTDMTVWFNDSTIDRLYVEGNVQMFMFPMENDSTYNKYIYLESSYMDAYFDGQQPKKINFWPETTYDVVPLYLAKRKDYRLPQFNDYTMLRPVSPDDVFNVSEDMINHFAAATVNPKWQRPPASSPAPPRSEPAATRPTEAVPESTEETQTEEAEAEETEAEESDEETEEDSEAEAEAEEEAEEE